MKVSKYAFMESIVSNVVSRFQKVSDALIKTYNIDLTFLFHHYPLDIDFDLIHTDSLPLIDQIIVDLDMQGYSFDVQDLLIFNIIQRAIYEHGINIDIHEIAEHFSIDVFEAYCFAIYLGMKNASNIHSDAVINKMMTIDNIRPLLFAKLFVKNEKRFIDAMKYAKSYELFAFMSKSFKMKMNIDRALFETILKKFNTHVMSFEYTQMFMN